ncbi:MAG: DUF1801 domain-containing protein [Chloroflexi bacterium]|nr:DUF1801 domain-containing protein [Chloroflexota bacterium]MCC6892948.1 DUF1801 domain-containing protein [Anaerolineae bacterium]
MAAKKAKPLNDTPAVDDYLAKSDHPFKAEMAAIRQIIMAAHPGITEGIKWNAPSFYYKGDMVVFTPHVRDHILMVFPNGIVIPDMAGLLEGDYKDRRMAHFNDMSDVQDKKAALEAAVRGWIQVMDAESE